MNWKIISIILKIPLVIFILASLVVSIYAAANKIQGINWITPMIMGFLILLYIISVFIDKQINK